MWEVGKILMTKYTQPIDYGYRLRLFQWQYHTTRNKVLRWGHPKMDRSETHAKLRVNTYFPPPQKKNNNNNIQYCWWFRNPANTSWGKGSLPTMGCRVSKTIVWDSINSIIQSNNQKNQQEHQYNLETTLNQKKHKQTLWKHINNHNHHYPACCFVFWSLN